MKTRRSKCPLANSLDIFGDRWTLLILRDMIFAGKKQYREFLQSSEKISTNILADRLQRLVNEDILCKEVHPENKKVFDFYFTSKGLELIPIVVDIVAWGARYLPMSYVPEDFLGQVDKDRDGLIQRLKERLIRS